MPEGKKRPLLGHFYLFRGKESFLENFWKVLPQIPYPRLSFTSSLLQQAGWETVSEFFLVLGTRGFFYQPRTGSLRNGEASPHLPIIPLNYWWEIFQFAAALLYLSLVQLLVGVAICFFLFL